ncbi:MAG: sigma-70 family RNA polymerase sigma factor [Clostridia bacterium]|nr:sigma-70 family RNA polymerase sigma factor [Clostridia bacterium]
MMTNEQAEELFREYRKTGDVKIRNKLVENYLYIAEILAKKFAGRGVEYDDLLQVASEALIFGVEKFDPDMGNRFTTYITPTITGMIKNYFRDYSRSVRLPRRIYTLNSKIKAYTNDYYKENGTKPTVHQIAAALGESEESVMEAMECHTPVSLDATVQGEDSDGLLYDVIPDPENMYEKLDDAQALKEEIKKLDPIEQQVVTLRFVQGKSQAEVGRQLGVSQMFVSRAERKIIEKLKDALSQ